MFAIVQIGGKQFSVSPGDILTVEHLDTAVGKTLTFDRVMLTNDGKATQVGTPIVEGVTVTAKILSHQKGEKIEVRRFKSKVRYRKHIGFRPHETTLSIVSVGT